MSLAADAIMEIQVLTAQRDEALEALRKIVLKGSTYHIHSIARAVLDKYKEGAEYKVVNNNVMLSDENGPFRCPRCNANVFHKSSANGMPDKYNCNSCNSEITYGEKL